MSFFNEAAKFLAGAAAWECFIHIMLFFSKTLPLQLGGFVLTPALNIMQIIISGLLASVLIYFAWIRRENDFRARTLNILLGLISCTAYSAVAQEAPKIPEKSGVQKTLILKPLFKELPQKDHKDLRICSFNIRRDGKEEEKSREWKNRKSMVIDFLKAAHPDILGLQEAKQNQVNDINSGISDVYNWVGDAVSGGEYRPIFYNKARLSKKQSGTFWLNPKHEKGKPGFGGTLERACTWAEFETKDHAQRKFFVFNTHLSSKSDGNIKNTQKNELRLILEKVKELTPRGSRLGIIIMGDFNMKASERSPINLIKEIVRDAKDKDSKHDKLKDYDKEFNDSYISAPIRLGPQKTKRGWNNQQEGRIDYILFTPNIFSAIQYCVVERADQRSMSDHNPLFVDLRIND